MRDLLEALCGVNVREIPFKTTEGMESLLSDFEVETVLVVNVASRCGLAPQYETLEKLQQRYGERGLQVVGFPSNQFLQELRSEWQGGKGSVELREVPPDDQRRGARNASEFANQSLDFINLIWSGSMIESVKEKSA